MRYLSLVLTVFLTLAFTSMAAQTSVGFRILSGSAALTSGPDALPANIGKHSRVSATTFGLVLERDIIRSISLRSGIQQAQRGTTIHQGSANKLLGATLPLDYEAQIRTSYLEVPLALKFHLPLAQDQVSFYGWGGITAGYALTGSIRSRSASSMNFQLSTTKLDMANYAFPRFHLGYNGGVGLGINLGETLQFRLEADYNRSVEKEAMLTPESGKHGYQSLHFGAGLAFRL